MLEIATLQLIESTYNKLGKEAAMDFLMGQSKNLAESMPEEEYKTWEDFVEAMTSEECMVSAVEESTKNLNGGNVFVTPVCPFKKTIDLYKNQIGAFPPLYGELKSHFNTTVRDSAVGLFCIMHQTFREEACKRIKIAGKPVSEAQIACKGPTGAIKAPPEQWKKWIVKEAKVAQSKIDTLLRNNACVWAVFPIE